MGAAAFRFDGKRAVVTGCSRGLCFALAQELRAQGARVAICARGEQQLYAARAKRSIQGSREGMLGGWTVSGPLRSISIWGTRFSVDGRASGRT